jgi:hypothetical protein
LTGARRAGLCQNLLLLGRENLLKLGLGLFFQLGDLFLLGCRKFQFLGHEPRQEMESTAWSARSTWSGTRSARTSGTAILRRGAFRAILCQGACGDRGRRENAQRKDEHVKTLHGQLLSKKPRGQTQYAQAYKRCLKLIIAPADGATTILAGEPRGM